MSQSLRSFAAASLLGAVSLFALPAFAEPHHADHHVPQHETVLEADGEQGGHGAHGDHVPHFSDINWFTGMIGEKEGVEPSFLWRAPGTPVPVGAMLFNTALLFLLIGIFGGPAIKGGLKSRKENIAGDIERAAKMKAEAEVQLAHYEDKLAEMQTEMERIKAEMRQQSENERERIVAEAKERAVSLEAEAKKIVEQQLAHARTEAVKQAVSGAVAAARDEIQKNLNPQDQERLAQDLLSSLESHIQSKAAQS